MILFTLLFIALSFPQASGKKGVPESKIRDPIRFDEWHDLVFIDEKARLDNLSIAWKGHSSNTIYLIVFAGKRACAGEAKARGLRAKNYLIKRHVPATNIVWVDAGYREEVTTEVWLGPSLDGQPILSQELNLKAVEVSLEKGCKIKYRGGTN